jgi:lysophospholipase L1-like esterase
VARSGARWSHQAITVFDTTLDGTGNNVMWNQANKIIAQVAATTIETPDVVYIMCGRNDTALTIGDIPTVFTGNILSKAPGEILTIAEGIRYTCETLLTAFPNVQIILGTPLQWANGTGLTPFQIADAVRTCAKLLSVSVVDVNAESGIYYKFEETANKYLSDSTHPNLAGAIKLGNYIASQLKLKVIQ